MTKWHRVHNPRPPKIEDPSQLEVRVMEVKTHGQHDDGTVFGMSPLSPPSGHYRAELRYPQEDEFFKEQHERKIEGRLNGRQLKVRLYENKPYEIAFHDPAKQ